jgi:hypothetical protein
MSWPSSQPIEDISKASDDSLSWAYNKGVKSIATVVRTRTVSMAQYEVIFFMRLLQEDIHIRGIRRTTVFLKL